MYSELELKYCTLDKEQVKEFAYNITGEIIDDYVKEHQEEFEKWKSEEYLKKIVNEAVGIKRPININERIKLIQSLKGGSVHEEKDRKRK